MKPSHLFTLSALGAALLGISTGAAADDTTLAPVVVTATRTPVTADDTLAAVTVISRAQIDTSGARDVGDLLRYYGGLNVPRYGGIGQLTSVSVRGASSDQTLVMVDGVAITEGSLGGANVQNLRPEDIDHIEIVGGPRSSLYGSSAIGGVINIITRRGGDSGTAVSLTAGGEGTLAGNVRNTISTDTSSATVSLGSFSTRGYAQFPDDGADRGYKNNDASMDLNYHKDDLTLRGRLQQNTGTDQYLGQPAPNYNTNAPVDQDFINTLGMFEASLQASENYKTTLRLSSYRDEINQNQLASVLDAGDPALFLNEKDFVHTRRNQADWQNDYNLPGNNLVTIGGTYTVEKVSGLSDGLGGEHVQHNTAVYIQDQWAWQAFSAQLAARQEHNEQFGKHATGELALGYAINKSNRLYATVGTGFRAPLANQLYGAFGANPNLQPELSVNREVGTKHELGDWTLGSAFFANDVKDLIASNSSTGFTYENVQQARFRGVELNAGFHHGGWSWLGKANYTSAINADTRAQLQRQPRRGANSSLDYQFETWSVGTEVAAQSMSAVGYAGPLPGYAVYNAHAAVALAKGVKLKLNLDNITNKRYGMEANGTLTDGNPEIYIAQPRLLSATLDVKF
jgi:vitamin B12 transporter